MRQLTNKDLINVFGIDNANSVRLKLWTGDNWEPSGDSTWSLGNLPEEKHGLASNGHASWQKINAEL